MLRSMYSGISGMKVNQTKLDIIGNNIANSGTTAYKSSRAKFSDMLSQTVKDATASSQNQGGINPSKVGLGVQLASIDRIMTQGVMQPTNRALDVGIDGDGFFMVSRGPVVSGDTTLEVNHKQGVHSITEQSLATANTEIMYTRDGSFTLDSDGSLLTSNGYRVLGYSLTNDNPAQNATEESPNTISTAGMNFRFGPGAQLNGYKIILGSVGAGTVTSADVNKIEKTITLNADFTKIDSVTTEQIESAINKGVAAAGIPQSIFVTGKPVVFSNLYSDEIIRGADATAPSAVSIAGLTLQLSEGSELNGYTFEIGKIGSGTMPSVDVNKTTKKITINGDFVTKSVMTATGIKDLINNALSTEGINQSITQYSGMAMDLSNVCVSTNDTGTNLTAINQSVVKSATSTGNTFGGLNITFDNGGQLNGYTLKYGDTTGAVKTSVDKTNKIITISGDLTDPGTLATLKISLNNELTKAGITTNKINDITGIFDIGDITNTLVLNGGTDLKSPKAIDFLGATINFPTGTEFNNVNIELSDIKSSVLTVEYDGASNTFKISGDFTIPGEITAQKLAQALNDCANKEGTFGTIDNTRKIKLTGEIKSFTGLTSNLVEGGIDLKTPDPLKVAGLDVSFTEGGALNGYKIQIGKISAGTKTSAEINTKEKTIIVNTDLVTDGATNAATVQNAIRQALTSKGINQSITISGDIIQLNGVESDRTEGGTPVQSINEDGVINYVDATQELHSYDGALKSLKIPEKVKVAGTEQELRVKSYTIDENGVINGVLEDGRVAALGQIALSSFKNSEGLVSLGENLYGSSVNSGDAVIKSGVGTINDDNSKGYGDTLQGMLEMSNVDLAEQFTDMIVSSRAFQANGKAITTGDEILQDIINLKR